MSARTAPPYKPRIVDQELVSRLEGTGAVLIEGPKACGKTETARQIAASEVLLDIDMGAREAAAVDPSLLLEGPTPRLIDEWQLASAIWNHVRRTVDDRQAPGQFILAGSAVPPDDITRHTGAGRIARLHMRPMTLFEVDLSSGEISLAQLLAGDHPRGAADTGLGVADIAREIAIGGWPGFRGLGLQQALRGVRDYLEEIRRVDVGRVEGRRRDPDRVGQLLASLARNVATEAAAATLARDTEAAYAPLKGDTVVEYLHALERLMIVENQPAWAPHLRSTYTLRKAPKRHFVDPSLAVAALRATPERLLSDLKLLGFLFESLAIRDLRVYSQPADARVFHYRDSHGVEVDAVVQTADGRWAAFEVKLGLGQVDEAATKLHKFLRGIDTGVCGAPALLGVIVASGYGYRREDGVMVIPIGALGP